MREDDRMLHYFEFPYYFTYVYLLGDSTCIINTNSSSLPSEMIPAKIDSSCHNRYESSNDHNYQPSIYFYDLKLAELIHNSQHSPCIYLDSQLCRSSSINYGLRNSSGSLSSNSYCSSNLNQSNMNVSELSIEMGVDQSPRQQTNKDSFISAHECVV